MNLPQISSHDGIVVVRDDLFPGGTKARVLPNLLKLGWEYVYCSPVFGYAQIALAISAQAVGAKATIFCAERRKLHERTARAKRHGAKIMEIPCGYMSVVRARARAYCKMFGGTLLPFGLDSEPFLDGLAVVARALPLQPSEVWAVAGSGVLQRALQKAWPSARFNAVRVGAVSDTGKAKLYVAPEKFERDALVKPPFPSCSNYDAKAWQFVKRHASPGALFWNVAA